MVYHYPAKFKKSRERVMNNLLALIGRGACTKKINFSYLFGVVYQVNVFIEQLQDMLFVVKIGINAIGFKRGHNAALIGQAPMCKIRSAIYNCNHLLY